MRTTASLASYLTNIAGRPVFDKTGITGTFDILVIFNPYAGRDNPPSTYYADQPDMTYRPSRSIRPATRPIERSDAGTDRGERAKAIRQLNSHEIGLLDEIETGNRFKRCVPISPVSLSSETIFGAPPQMATGFHGEACCEQFEHTSARSDSAFSSRTHQRNGSPVMAFNRSLRLVGHTVRRSQTHKLRRQEVFRYGEPAASCETQSHGSARATYGIASRVPPRPPQCLRQRPRIPAWDV